MPERHRTPALFERPAVRWFAFLGGPFAWVAQLIVGYFNVAVICGVAESWLVGVLLHLVSVSALTVTLIAGATGVLIFRRGHAVTPSSLDEPDEPSEFLGAAGSLISVLFLIVISLTWAGVFLVSPCA